MAGSSSLLERLAVPNKEYSAADNQGGGDAYDDASFSVEVRRDRLAVLLTCRVPAGDLGDLEWHIRRELVKLGVVNCWKEEDLGAWLRSQVQDNPQLEKVVLVEGTRPVQPVDGRIEWAKDYFSKGFLVDAQTGAIDYRKHVAQRSVKKGELLARIIPPKPGVDGRDVFGRRISTRRPGLPRIRAQRNIRVDEEEDAYYADAEGRIHWVRKNLATDNAGGFLSVDVVFVIPGSVNLETGDITHPGAVVVEHDVEEGATVEAGGDLEIKGVVEPSHLKVGGNLSVRGGIAGSADYKMVIDGTIRAKFILDACIDAAGDIIVESEIRHAHIRTRGAVTMPNGRIIGGSVLALGGITVEEAGSYNVPTELITCEDYRLNDELAEKHREQEELEEALERIQLTLKPLIPRLKLLSPEKKKALAGLLEKAKELEVGIQGLGEEMEALKSLSRTRSKKEIRMSKCVYPETTLGIQGERFIVRHEFPGPAVAILSEGLVKLQQFAGRP